MCLASVGDQNKIVKIWPATFFYWQKIFEGENFHEFHSLTAIPANLRSLHKNLCIIYLIGLAFCEFSMHVKCSLLTDLWKIFLSKVFCYMVCMQDSLILLITDLRKTLQSIFRLICIYCEVHTLDCVLHSWQYIA